MIKTKKVIENANSITEGLVALINCEGHYAGRINTTGIYDPAINQFRRMKQEERGKSDVAACINGRFVAIEIKYLRDKTSKYQKAYRARVEAAGGIYVIIKTWEQAIEWWNTTGINIK